METLSEEQEELNSRQVSLREQKTGIEHELAGLNQRLGKVPQPGDQPATVKESSLEQAELDPGIAEDNIYSYFRRVYSLRLRSLMGKDYMHSQLESGSYHLDALEEELLQKRQVAFDWGS